jgi:hypothetical protein
VEPIRVGLSFDISWFVEKRQDWKKAVLVGRSEVRVGPSCDLSSLVGALDWKMVRPSRSVLRLILARGSFGLEDGPSVVELTFELTGTTVVGFSWFVEKRQER